MKLLRYNIYNNVCAFSTERDLPVESAHVSHYEAFNIASHCGDDELHVERCRMELCRQLGIASGALFLPHQIHGTCVRRVDSHTKFSDLEGVDALISDVPGVCIGVSTADCIPVLLFDPDKRACAAIHAGWRGTVARIVELTVEEMQRQFGTNPTHIHAVIGPGISMQNFEVGDEVYKAFEDAGFPMEHIARRYPADSFAVKWHINLPAANKLQLLSRGIPASNVYDCGVCTFTQHYRFFSARRLGIRSGRIFTGIMMNK